MARALVKLNCVMIQTIDVSKKMATVLDSVVVIPALRNVILTFVERNVYARSKLVSSFYLFMLRTVLLPCNLTSSCEKFM